MPTSNDSVGPYGKSTEELVRSVAAVRAAGKPLALLVIQIDELEKVEIALGRSASARLANKFASEVRAVLRGDDQLVQIGDRKFWVILRGIRNQGHAELAASKFARIGKGPFRVGDHSLKLDTVIGIAMFPDHAEETDELSRRADLALATAREENVPFQVYSDDSTRQMANHWKVEHELDQALEQSEFELYFQPKIRLPSLTPCGAEALLRWNNPLRGQLPPGEFLPIAERTGRMEAITWFVIDAAQRQRCEWPAQWADLPVSVNVPPSVLDSGKLLDYVKNSLRIWGTKPGHLMLEITEDAVVRNPQRSFSALAELRKQGIQISIDDFGTGYSSMTYFKDMPADEIKIDKSFMLNLARDPGNQHIVRAIIDLAHAFHYKVVAEGVETEDVLNVLQDMQCDVIQGYLFSRPQPQREFIQWLSDFGEPAGKLARKPARSREA